jgi:hypothetical protein
VRGWFGVGIGRGWWFQAIIVDDVVNSLVSKAGNARLSAISQPQAKITKKAFVSASKMQFLMH